MVGQLLDLCDYAAVAVVAGLVDLLWAMSAHSLSQVSMWRGLTWSRTASSWPLESGAKWLVMMAVAA